MAAVGLHGPAGVGGLLVPAWVNHLWQIDPRVPLDDNTENFGMKACSRGGNVIHFSSDDFC
jgi:hypothetical protein